MSRTQDPTFYRTPADAIKAPPERLAYVAAFDPAGQVKDAITVLDTDPSSPDYGQIVGWSELPTASNNDDTLNGFEMTEACEALSLTARSICRWCMVRSKSPSGNP